MAIDLRKMQIKIAVKFLPYPRLEGYCVEKEIKNVDKDEKEKNKTPQ